MQTHETTIHDAHFVLVKTDSDAGQQARVKCTHKHTHMNACAHACTHTYTNTHTHTHTHTHVHAPNRRATALNE